MASSLEARTWGKGGRREGEGGRGGRVNFVEGGRGSGPTLANQRVGATARALAGPPAACVPANTRTAGSQARPGSCLQGRGGACRSLQRTWTAAARCGRARRAGLSAREESWIFCCCCLVGIVSDGGEGGGACARQPPREPDASHQSPLRVTRGGRGCAHRAGVGGPSVTGAARSWLTARRLPAAPQIRPRLGLRQAPPPATAGDPSPQALCHRPLTPPGPATQCGGRGRRAWRFLARAKK